MDRNDFYYSQYFREKLKKCVENQHDQALSYSTEYLLLEAESFLESKKISQELYVSIYNQVKKVLLG